MECTVRNGKLLHFDYICEVSQIRMNIKQYRVEIKWALIIIGVTWLWSLAERLCGLHDEHIARVRFYGNFFIIPLVFLYLAALADKRRADYNGRISFKQGLRSGVVLTILLTVLSPLTQYVIATIISPHFFNHAAAYIVSEGILGEDDARAFFSLGNYIRNSIMSTPVIGLLVALFAAIIVPKIGSNKPKEIIHGH